jgi:hypothetical protein
MDGATSSFHGNESASSPVMSKISRSYSNASERRPSLVALASPLAAISPEPAYIALAAASQIITADHEAFRSTADQQYVGETVLVSRGAVKLINGFLDQLLYRFLATSRSTSLASLRTAVSEILKPRLAHEVITTADQELHEYLGGGEDEELLTFHNGQEPTGEWDLERVWKRTRLRCMVYSSLGDMEEEDEDMYAEQDNLDRPAHNRFSNSSGIISPAVAIFLTSILEFIGEQTLIVAGRSAYNRLQRSSQGEALAEEDGEQRLMVEDKDTEKVALNTTFGRLWRQWKNKLRSPTGSLNGFSRPQSPEMILQQHSRDLASNDVDHEVHNIGMAQIAEGDKEPAAPLAEVEEPATVEELAASFALPESLYDVVEIEGIDNKVSLSIRTTKDLIAKIYIF